MTLSRLIKNSGISGIPAGFKDFQVEGIACNSNLVRNGFVFVAIKGNKADGHKFIPDAITRGARVVIYQDTETLRHRDAGTKTQGHQAARRHGKILFIKARDTRKTLAGLAGEFYGNPSSRVKVAGVTGTNGKTTITYLIEALLKGAGLSPAVIGTINYRFKNKIIPSKNTTPGPLELQGMMKKMADKGADHVVMEVSSHALDQDRVEGMNFSSAIFTNLTQDHLDYHKTMRKYFLAKAKLFQRLSRKSSSIINADDRYGRKLKEVTRSGKIITYGIRNKADLKAVDIRMNVHGSEFTIKGLNKRFNLKSRLSGRHNIYNILAAVGWALSQGMEVKDIQKGIERFSLVPGRLERIDARGGFSVFVDYAHTDDALKNVITTLRKLTQKKVIVVFGCGGDRDKAKRPKMARVVSALADQFIITNDNPRSEEPLSIISDIKKGVVKGGYWVIPDRKKAIKKAIHLASRGDIVLVAGKGHENYQILKDKTTHFDDREAVRECLV